jgi:hypothetical protein
MSWMDDRDRLIADTLAFVKEISGDQPELASRSQEAIALEVADPRNLKQILPEFARMDPLELADLREDIQARVAAFKALQRRLQDEREDYFRKTLERARATRLS